MTILSTGFPKKGFAALQRRLAATLATILLLSAALPLAAQTQSDADDDDDIWRSVKLGNLDYAKAKNKLVRIYSYFRYIDDGVMLVAGREFKLYRVSEGICELDIRYNKEVDDGARELVTRNLVHPDRPGAMVEYYELKPHTFLEQARREPKNYTISTDGDTTRVYTKRGLAGTVVRDTLRRELRMSYNALAPDTALSLNLLILKAHLSHVDAEAVYRLDDADQLYVPQGALKHISFEGDIHMQSPLAADLRLPDDEDSDQRGMTEDFHERTEFFVDTVVYLTRDQYRAEKKLSLKERCERLGYTRDDIDRVKLKLGVPPLSAAVMARIEEQQDWDDAYNHWVQSRQKARAIQKAAKAVQKAAESDKVQKAVEDVQQQLEQQQEKQK